MPPNATSAVECTGVLDECDAETVDGALDKNVVELKHANERELKLVWRNIILFAVVHLSAVYGLWLLLTSARIYTSIFGKRITTLFPPKPRCLSGFPPPPHFFLNFVTKRLFAYFYFSLQLWFYIYHLD